jgi:hypothetical protein
MSDRARQILRESRNRAVGGLLGRGYNELRRKPGRIRPEVANYGTVTPPANTVIGVLPRGTILFRGVSTAPNLEEDLSQMRFHYFHPIGGFAVAARTYNRFCMFMTKYPIKVLILINPASHTKNDLISLFHSEQLNKNWCKETDIQGYIAIDSSNAGMHTNMFSRYSNIEPLKKFLHRDTRSLRGFPECVLWYDDFELMNRNMETRQAGMIVELISCVHIPDGSKEQKIRYVLEFYQALGNDLTQNTHIQTSAGTVEFPFFTSTNVRNRNSMIRFLHDLPHVNI